MQVRDDNNTEISWCTVGYVEKTVLGLKVRTTDRLTTVMFVLVFAPTAERTVGRPVPGLEH